MPFGAAAAAVAGGVASAATSSLLSGRAAHQAAGGASTAQSDLTPYLGAGTAATKQEQDLLGLNGPDAATTAMSTFQSSPGYQFQLGQGLRTIDAGAAARGILSSGGTIKAEQAYGSGLANQDFSNYYNRLFNLSQLGETAGAGGAALAQGAGNTQAGISANLGSTLASTTSSIFGNKDVQNALGTGIKSLFGSSGTTPLATGDFSGTPVSTLTQVGLA